MITSLDVFDTIIVRAWWSPDDVFLACGHDLAKAGLWSGTPVSWRGLRVGTELEARKVIRHDDITLDEIYGLLAERANWTSEQARTAKDLELRCEMRSYQPVSSAAPLLDQTPNVILVSDTYFPKEFISANLARLYPQTDLTGVPIFCSSEVRAAKNKKTLFPHVCKTLNIAPEQIWHHGDNLHSDVSIPRRHGLKAMHWTATRPTAEEIHLRGRGPEARLLLSAVAGAARATRLSGEHKDEHLRNVWDMGADIVGPFLFAYCAWVLAEAQARGIRDLFFFARDGQILAQIADKISKAVGFNVGTHYIYASRQAYFFPAIADIGTDTFAQRWLYLNRDGKSPRQLLARLNLTPEEARLIDPSVCEGLPDDSRHYDQTAFLDRLLASGPIRAHINAAAAEKCGTLLAYLRHVGLLQADTDVGVVDVGWNGSLQQCLQGIIDRKCGPDHCRLHGFYIGLRQPYNGQTPSRFNAFTNTSKFNEGIVECFTQADHGSVISVERTPEGQFCAKLCSETNKEAITWGLATFHAAILRFTDLACASIAGRSDLDTQACAALRAQVLKVVSPLCHFPTAKQSKVFGSVLFADDQTHSNYTHFAPQVSFGQILRSIATRRYTGPGYLWMPGSIAQLSNSKRLNNFIQVIYLAQAKIRKYARVILSPFGLR